MVNIGGIVSSGFELIARRPGALFGWAAVLLLGALLTTFLQFHLLGTDMAVEPELSLISPDNGASALSAKGVAISIMIGLVSTTISTILTAAAIRAWIYPEDRGLASLRFGADELRMIALALLLYLLFFAAGLFLVPAWLFVVSASGLASGGNGLVAPIVGIALLILLVCAIIYVAVRLSLVFPLVLLRGRIGIDESWERTRGHFWPLLGAYVLLVLITGAVALLAYIPLFIIVLMTSGFDLSSLERTADAMVINLVRGDFSSMAWWVPVIVFVSALFNAISLTLTSVSQAEATLQLTGEAAEPEPETY